MEYRAKNGYPIISYLAINEYRQADKHRPKQYKIIEQEGGQEKLLQTPADITIYGGMRGCAKSFSLLLDGLNDCYNKNFRSIIMRKEINDLSDLVDTSKGIFSQFGEYNRSKGDMTWNFHNGGWLTFGYYGDSYDDFKTRYQGKQFSLIGIDEITHMEYKKFKYMMTDNRNAFFIRNRIIGTCNPDPDSWVARFIEWWIGEDGLPIDSRDGQVRYCFMDGDDVSGIFWGNSREEVYEMCKGTIDRISKGYEDFGDPKDMFIRSVCFIAGKLKDNVQLLRSDPGYLANLANQSEEARARDLEGNWKYKTVGDNLIKTTDIDNFYENSVQGTDGKVHCSCDIALEGGDNLVMVKWVNNLHHIDDIFVCNYSGKQTADVVKAKLKEWGVDESNFTYDLNGLGQWFKGKDGYFPRAVPFCNTGAVDPKLKYVYANLKSQAAYVLAQKIINKEISINHRLLDKKFSGNGYSNVPLRDILNLEFKIIRQDKENTDRGFALPRKKYMKAIIGHSPDFVEAIMMAMIFEIQHKEKKIKGLGLI